MGGCDGKTGSILQLNTCNGGLNQKFAFDVSGSGFVIRSNFTAKLCIAPPPKVKSAEDQHSIVADPLFVDVDKGNFSLRPNSPAFSLGFEPLPPIEAPSSRCSSHACLVDFINLSAAKSLEWE